MKKILSMLLSVSIALSTVVGLTPSSYAAQSVVTRGAMGWLESAVLYFDPADGSTQTNVYYKKTTDSTYTKIDDQLVRKYDTFWRADIMGISKGTYDIKAVPVFGGNEDESRSATIPEPVTVLSHDRSGYAFANNQVPGAYKKDGTPKDGAKIIYLSADDMSGFHDVFTAGGENVYTNPIIMRILGYIPESKVPSKNSTGMIEMKAKKGSTPNITVEGVGRDAALNVGIAIKGQNMSHVELRNFAIINFKDDGIGVEKCDAAYFWFHNLDMFYGAKGSASDQKKGDGTMDLKTSQYITLSYNHFWDSGKCHLLANGTSDTADLITYHHNWYDHSDSRHPRIRSANAHIYNNYFVGIGKYAVGAAYRTKGVFAEGNVFERSNRPLTISMQGADDGTFSSEDGGIIKAHNNFMDDKSKQRYTPYSSSNTVEFDAYEVKNRSDTVPSDVKAKKGGSTYNNFDTSGATATTGAYFDSDWQLQSAQEDIVDRVQKYAGRMQNGDIWFEFKPGDENHTDDKMPALANLIDGYNGTNGNLKDTPDAAVVPAEARGLSGERTGENTATIKFTPLENGKYWYLMSSAETATLEEVKKGTSGDATAGKEVTVNITPPDTNGVKVFVVVQNTKPIDSRVYTIHVDKYVDPSIPEIEPDKATRASGDEGEFKASVSFIAKAGVAGTAHYIVKNSGDSAPTREELKASTATVPVTAAGGTIRFDAIIDNGDAKDIYIVQFDATGNKFSEIIKLELAKFLKVGEATIINFSVSPYNTVSLPTTAGEFPYTGIDGITITGKGGSNSLPNIRDKEAAVDGFVFSKVYTNGGASTATGDRQFKFTTFAPGMVEIYADAGSNAGRKVSLWNASGDELDPVEGNVALPSTVSGRVVYQLPEAGTYAIGCTAGGIFFYQISIENLVAQGGGPITPPGSSAPILVSNGANRLSKADGNISFTSSKSGTYFVLPYAGGTIPSEDEIDDSDITGPINAAETITLPMSITEAAHHYAIVILDDDRNEEGDEIYSRVIAMTIPGYSAPGAPKISNGSASRTAVETAKVTFTSDVGGSGYQYRYMILTRDSTVPTAINVIQNGVQGNLATGTNTIDLTGLTGGAKTMYVLGYRQTDDDELIGELIPIPIPNFVAIGGGDGFEFFATMGSPTSPHIKFASANTTTSNAISYKGIECSNPIKMESKTTIEFTPTADGILTIVFAVPASGATLNGAIIKPSSVGGNNVWSDNVKANTKYTLTRNSTNATIAYIGVEYAGGSTEPGDDEPEITAPDAPQNVKAESTNAGEVTVTWDAPANDGGSPVLKYCLSLDNGVTWIASVDGSTFRQLFTDLEPGELTIIIHAESAEGISQAEAVTVTVSDSAPTNPGAPGAVSGFSAIPNDKEVNLSWAAPANTGTSAITAYYVQVGASPAVKLPATQTNYKAEGLTNGTEYTFKVWASNDAGDGPITTRTAIPTDGTAPDRHLDLKSVYDSISKKDNGVAEVAAHPTNKITIGEGIRWFAGGFSATIGSAADQGGASKYIPATGSGPHVLAEHGDGFEYRLSTVGTSLPTRNSNDTSLPTKRIIEIDVAGGNYVEVIYGTVGGSSSKLLFRDEDQTDGTGRKVVETFKSDTPELVMKRFSYIAKNAGTCKIYATGDVYIYDIIVSERIADKDIVPVTGISGVRNQMEVHRNIILGEFAKVQPEDATFTQGVWSVEDPGTTGAVIDGRILKTTATGTLKLKATIPFGKGLTEDYVDVREIEIVDTLGQTTKSTPALLRMGGLRDNADQNQTVTLGEPTDHTSYESYPIITTGEPLPPSDDTWLPIDSLNSAHLYVGANLTSGGPATVYVHTSNDGWTYQNKTFRSRLATNGQSTAARAIIRVPNVAKGDVIQLITASPTTANNPIIYEVDNFTVVPQTAITVYGTLRDSYPEVGETKFVTTSFTAPASGDYHFYTKANTYIYEIGVNPADAPSITEPPTTVQNLTATGIDNGINVSWAPPANDGGSSITGYEIQVGSDAPITVEANVTSYNITGLTEGTEYVIKVTAINTAGKSTPIVATEKAGVNNDETYLFIPLTDLPNGGTSSGAVDNGQYGSHKFFTVGGSGNKIGGASGDSLELPKEEKGWVEFTIADTANVVIEAGSTGGSNTSKILLKNASNSTISEKTGINSVTGTNRTELNFENLPAGTYKILNDDGSKGRGTRIYSVSVTVKGGGTAPIDIKPVTGIEWDKDGDTVTAGDTVSLLGTTVTPADATNRVIVWSVVSGPAHISGNQLVANAEGTVTLRATITNGVAVGENFTKTFTINVDPGAAKIYPPEAVTNLDAVAGDGEVTLTWAAPAADGGETPKYKVTVNPGGTTIDDISALTYTATGLTNGTAYTFGVIAYNTGGDSTVVTKTATPFAPVFTTVPSEVRELNAVPGDGFVTLSWTAPLSNGGLTILSYGISQDGVDLEAITARTLEIQGLTNDQEYTFEVWANNSKGAGPKTETKATPKAATVTNIAVTYSKVEYYVGDKLDLSGMSIELTYSDSNKETLTYDEFLAKGGTIKLADADAEHDVTELTIDHNNSTIELSIDGVTKATVALKVTVSPTPYDAELTVTKDGAEWIDSGKTLTLKKSDQTDITLTAQTGEATYKADAILGDGWALYADDADTGIIISEANKDATIAYFTVKFDYVAEDAPAGTTVTLTANYNGAAIQTGDVVLGGKNLSIVASAKLDGKTVNYEYQWNDAATTKNAKLDISALNAAVDVICTISGEEDIDPPTGKQYVFEASVDLKDFAQEAMVTAGKYGTDSFFTIALTGDGILKIGKSSTHTLEISSKERSWVEFTLTKPGSVEVFAGSTGAPNVSTLELKKDSTVIAEKTEKATVTGTAPVSFVYENLSAGTYKILTAGTARGVRIHKVIVTTEGDAPTFKPVTGITWAPNGTTVNVGEGVSLNATVTPSDATNRTIVWSVNADSTTLASISGNILTANAAGTINITATIANGAGETEDYTKNFSITAEELPVTLTSIVVTGDIKLQYTEGESLDLSAMRITLNYSDNTKKEDLTLTQFLQETGAEIKFSDGTAVTDGLTLATTHNGKTMVLSLEGKEKATDALVVKVDNSYTASVTVKKDNGAFNDFGKALTLTKAGSTTKTLTLASGVYTVDKVEGDGWTVCVDGVSTGKTISKANSDITLDYYTVEFDYDSTTAPNGTTVEMTAHYGADLIESGAVVLAGKKLTIDAEANIETDKVVNITYLWNDANNTTKSQLVLDSLAEKVDVTCTVSGTISELTLSKIEITKLPEMEYTEGDSVNLEELEVTFTFGSSGNEVIEVKTGNEIYDYAGVVVKLGDKNVNSIAALTKAHDGLKFTISLGDINDETVDGITVKEKAVVKGDISNSGEIDTLDAILLLRYTIGLLDDYSNIDVEKADINEDGILDNRDVTCVLRVLADLPI